MKASSLACVSDRQTDAVVLTAIVSSPDAVLSDVIAVVSEGANNVAPGQPLAVIVPSEADIVPFVQVLKENPRCIEGARQRVNGL
jgi:hypothetical protein